MGTSAMPRATSCAKSVRYPLLKGAFRAGVMAPPVWSYLGGLLQDKCLNPSQRHDSKSTACSLAMMPMKIIKQPYRSVYLIIVYLGSSFLL